jgi:hypothetical protein
VKLPPYFHAPFNRERDRIRAEMQRIQGLLPLLMKERNGSRWSPDERAQLQDHLRNLRALAPYVLVLLAPGSFILLPLLAWWLDRRRQKRNDSNRTAPAARPSREGGRPRQPENL